MKILNFVSYTTSPILTGLIGIITVPLLANIFSADDIGRYSFLIIVTPVALNVVLLGLDQAYVREFHLSKDKDLLYASAMWPPILIFASFATIAMFFADLTSTLLFGIHDSAISVLAIASVFFTLLIRRWSLVARMQEQGLLFSITLIAPKAFFLFFLVWLYINNSNNSLEILLCGYLASLIFSALILGIRLKIRPIWSISFTESKEETLRLLKYGLPAAMGTLTYSLILALGPLMVRSFSNFQELAILSIATSLSAFAGLIQNAFASLWGPQIYKSTVQNVIQGLKNKYESIAVMAFTFLLSTSAIFSWVIIPLFPANYYGVDVLISGMAYVALINMVREVTGIGILLTRNTRWILWVNLSGLAAMFVFSILLIPTLGSKGAVIAGVASSFIMFLAATFISTNFGFPPANPGKLYGFTYIATFLTICLTLLPGNDQLSLICRLFWTVLLTVAIVTYRTNISLLFNSIIKWRH